MRTCAAGLPAGAAALLLAFLKKTGFGERGVSNFTKSFSALSFFFKGLSAPGLPCVQGEKGGGHTQSPLCHTPTQEAAAGQQRGVPDETHSAAPRRTPPFRSEAPDTLAPSSAAPPGAACGLGVSQGFRTLFLCLQTQVLCPSKPL